MAFDTLQVEAIEGCHPSTREAHYQHGVGRKEKLGSNQQPHGTKLTFYSCSDL